MADADHVLTLTPRQAAFVHFLGRYLRKQDGWWDDQDWQDTAWEVAELFEALPGTARDVSSDD